MNDELKTACLPFIVHRSSLSSSALQLRLANHVKDELLIVGVVGREQPVNEGYDALNLSNSRV